MKPPQEQLERIAAASPDLDHIEAALRHVGQEELAGRLLKLQQDIGLELLPEMGEPLGGPRSAALRQAYEPVTMERLGVLAEVAAQLAPGPLQDTVMGLSRSNPSRDGRPVAYKAQL